MTDRTIWAFITALCLACSSFSVYGQEISNKGFNPQTPVSYPKQGKSLVLEERSPLRLPDVNGYKVLKCDFHMHTVFSDGSVWPTTRVEEAFREGLDVMAITEHLEFHHLHAKDVHAEENLNREYELALPVANRLGILLIPGAEITREVPAGHFNVLFLKDANLLKKFINAENRRDTTTLAATLAAAKEQGCFIFWNHPAYGHPKRMAEWFDIHENLYQKGLITGIEVANSNVYIPVVQKWAEEKELTIFSNSDYHHSVYMPQGCYRPMTLVFAKERSVEAVREALEKRRTVAFAQNYLYGDADLLKGLVANSLQIRCLSSNKKETVVEIENVSGLNFDMEVLKGERFHPGTSRCLIRGGKTTAIVLANATGESGSGRIKVKIHNFVPYPGQELETELVFSH